MPAQKPCFAHRVGVRAHVCDDACRWRSDWRRSDAVSLPIMRLACFMPSVFCVRVCVSVCNTLALYMSSMFALNTTPSQCSTVSVASNNKRHDVT